MSQSIIQFSFVIRSFPQNIHNGYLCPMLKHRWDQTGVLRYCTKETCQYGNVAMCVALMKYKNTRKSSLHECLLCPPTTKLAKGVCGSSPASAIVKDLVDLCRLGTQSDRMYLCLDMEFVIDGGNDALIAIWGL